MMMNRDLQVSTPSDREILMTREFDAAPQLVFDAWTKPELLKRWFGPPGWELPECEVDLRIGGRWRYLMRKIKGGEASEYTGEEMGISGTYQDIQEPTLLVTDEKFDEAWYEGDCLDRLEFVDLGGKTLFKLTTTYDSKEVRDSIIASGASGGLNESLNRLDELLAAKA